MRECGSIANCGVSTTRHRMGRCSRFCGAQETSAVAYTPTMGIGSRLTCSVKVLSVKSSQ